MRTWEEMFPDGRFVFYDGDTPEVFVACVKEEFNFDPSKNNEHWNKKHGYGFICPGHLMDKLYGSGKYPLGS